MKITKGVQIKTLKEVTIPIMPPILFGRLVGNKVYEVVKVSQGEVELMEVVKGCRQQVAISMEQLQDEFLANSIQLI
jgi:hypothetical protein